jgi:DNA polymerase II small subunit
VDEREIIEKFLNNCINIHPSVVQELMTKNADEIERILAEVEKRQNIPDVLTLEDLRLLEEGSSNGSVDSMVDMGGGEREQVVVVKRRSRRVLAEDHDPELEIRWERDITKKSYSAGNLEGFLDYFNYRFEKLAKILRERDPMRDAATIEWTKNLTGTSDKNSMEVRIIGMVNDVRQTKKGHVVIELEDPTGIIPALVLSTDRDIIKKSREIVKDEVIGIEGSTGKGRDLVIVREIFFPDIPVKNGLKKSDVPLALALLSDLHVGNKKFIEEDFLKFIKWIRGELGNSKQRDLAKRVKYLIIGGDLVDGVGIYPEQESELNIKDIYGQYAKIAEYLSMVPDYVEIVILPGNHDAVRQAEPQPAIMEEYAGPLYDDDRIHMTGNPSFIRVHGVEVLAYHGRSLDDVISTIHGMSYAEPTKAMLALVKKRHLTPIYGGKVPIAPESMDYMLIEDVPDIFHFGHAHAIGVSNYRGTILVNSGTFQEQTAYQRRLNMDPTPSQVPIIDLQAQRTTIMKFDL